MDLEQMEEIVCCVKEPDPPPTLRVHDLATGKDQTLGIGWFRANWMPDGKSVVANGWTGRKPGMARLSLDDPEKRVELTTKYEGAFSPCCSRDGKQIIFIARRSR